MRKFLLTSTMLVCAGTAQAQLQTGNIGGMPYYLLPASGGCSAATPCSVVTYLGVQSESAGAIANDVNNYFGGAFAQANPHTIVIAPQENGPQDETTNWGGYKEVKTPEGSQMVAVVQGVEAQMGNTVNPLNSVVTGGSLGGTGTQNALAAYGPKGMVQPGVFSAGVSFDAALWTATDPSVVAALCGVPLTAVHGVNDTNQNISFDQNLGAQINNNPACGNSFTLVPIAGAGHGTWSGPSGYQAGTGPGTPLATIASDLNSTPTSSPAARTSTAAATMSATTPVATTATQVTATQAPAPATTSPGAPTAAAPAPKTGVAAATDNAKLAVEEIDVAQRLMKQTNPNELLVGTLLDDATTQLNSSLQEMAGGTTPTAAGSCSGASTSVTPGQGSLTDSTGNVWTINDSTKIMMNGVPVMGGGDTSEMTLQGCTVMGHSNGANGSSTNWFTMNSANPTATDGWTVSASPTGEAPTAGPPPATGGTTPAPAAPGSPPIALAPTVCGSGVPSGAFNVAGGEIMGPGGPFIGKGVNVYDSLATGDADQIFTMFPGANILRIGMHSYSDPSSWDGLAQKAAARGTVLLFENHPDAGGGQDSGPPGGIAAESAWYAAMAAHFKDNPYVWLGTFNEPKGTANLSSWHQSTVQAIRGTGNNNIIVVYVGGELGVLQPSVYAAMKNIVYDIHYYGGSRSANTDQELAGMVNSFKPLVSADGEVPPIIGEYGDSQDGTNVDSNAVAAVTSVINLGSSGLGSSGRRIGSAAWAYNPGGNADRLQNGGALTSPYGQMVALYINETVQPCSAAQTTANANTNLATITAAANGTPATTTTPGATQPAATPAAAVTDPNTDAANASIAQANAIIAGAQAQMQPMATATP